ncbi:MAG TPA: hypothetical protein VIJ09_14070 [Acidimicrobiales bacterium]|jgi:hypothetical protein
MRRVRTGPVEAFVFTPDDPSVVLAHMDRLGAAHKGWINFNPGVLEEDVPAPRGGLGPIFGGTVHEIPICTWVPGGMGRKGVERDSLGIQHNTGTKVVARLATLDLALPAGWRWQQDHPRRGLVVRVPTDVTHAVQLSWLLTAGAALSKVPLTGDWEAQIREGR